MRDLAAAFALLLVIEGGLYALFPGGMKRMIAEVLRLPEPTIRNIGQMPGHEADRVRPRASRRRDRIAIISPPCKGRVPSLLKSNPTSGRP